jgi:hypothetical protein
LLAEQVGFLYLVLVMHYKFIRLIQMLWGWWMHMMGRVNKQTSNLPNDSAACSDKAFSEKRIV